MTFNDKKCGIGVFIWPTRIIRLGHRKCITYNKESWRFEMLILTRRVGETLMVGDDVSVTVLGVKGNQVRIGVNAPKEVSVHREEIYQRIQKEKLQKLAEYEAKDKEDDSAAE